MYAFFYHILLLVGSRETCLHTRSKPSVEISFEGPDNVNAVN